MNWVSTSRRMGSRPKTTLLAPMAGVPPNHPDIRLGWAAKKPDITSSVSSAFGVPDIIWSQARLFWTDQTSVRA